MERVAVFEKVSRERYLADLGAGGEESYGAIRLPRRATAHSAGYDFFAPYDVFLPAGGTAVVKTGVRAWRKGGCFCFIREAVWALSWG